MYYEDSNESSLLVWGVVFLIYALPVFFVIFCGGVGAWVERRHYRSIREREARWLHLPAIPTRTLDSTRGIAEARLVAVSVVISLDRFKRFLASLRNIFGGRVKSYETLLDRSRREAVLRMKEECSDADLIANLRIETSSIANSRGKQGVGGIEVLAYGTAIRYTRDLTH